MTQIDRRGAERDCGELTTKAEFKEYAVSPRRTTVKAVKLSECGRTVTVLIAGFAGFGSETRYQYWLQLEFETSHLCSMPVALGNLCVRSTALVFKRGISRSRTTIQIGGLTFVPTQDRTALIARSLPVLHPSGSATHIYSFTLPFGESNLIRAVARRAVCMRNKVSRPAAQIPIAYTINCRGHWSATM
ncbi:MAG: hypothetical protein IT355_04740 [Gemmatimonadaceae bacterium]|nr:hypothetical protein [Gemmatimonadaceae bacterium]